MIKKIISLVLILQFAFLNSNIVFGKDIFKKPENIEITKEEPEELESFIGYAKYNYKAYKYKIKNNGEKTCSIIANIEIDNIYRDSAIKFREDMLHSTVQLAILTPIAVIPAAPFLMLLQEATPIDILAILGLHCIVRPIKAAIVFPYDMVKNIKGTRKAKKELKKYEKYLIDKDTPIVIKPGEAFEFYAFTTNGASFIATFDKNSDKYHFYY